MNQDVIRMAEENGEDLLAESIDDACDFDDIWQDELVSYQEWLEEWPLDEQMDDEDDAWDERERLERLYDCYD